MKHQIMKSYQTLLHSSELIVKLHSSKSYIRLVSILYGLSLAFAIHSSLYFSVKCGVVLLVLLQFSYDYRHKKPHSNLSTIKYNQSQWVLVMNNGSVERYEALHILIHNPLFQLTKYATSKKNRFLILFNDQVTKDELRLIHLKSTQH